MKQLSLLMLGVVLLSAKLLGQPNRHIPAKIVYDASLQKWLVFYVNSEDPDNLFIEYSTDSLLDNTSPMMYYSRGNSIKKIMGATPLPKGENGNACFVTYGNSGLVTSLCGNGFENENLLDTIPYAKTINDLEVPATADAFALITAGNDSTYLAKTKNGKWEKSPNPIRISKKLSTSIRNWMDGTYMLIVVMGLMLLAIFWYQKLKWMKQFEVLQKQKETIDQSLFTKSDHPLGMDEDDLLEFNHIENAVINLIKNPDATLPLTIVISGKWGSGKSSMMNRIREKLETGATNKGHFLTTWFNAWHLQGESNLLNSFLISMTKFYEKYVFAFFRLRLLRIRLLKLSLLKQFLFWMTLTTTVFILILLLYKIVILNTFKIPMPFFDRYIHQVGFLISDWDKLQAQGKTFFVLLNFIVGGLSVFSIIFLNKGLKSEGLNTFTELLNLQQFKADSGSQQPGYREKFKEDFWDILRASDKGKKTVVFIDDIDRISGQKILELLEVINFMSDTASLPDNDFDPEKKRKDKSAKMVFVLGMATEEVACNLGKQLAALNDSKLDPLELGLNYIEKMVQLVVSVPFDETDDAKLKLLTDR